MIATNNSTQENNELFPIQAVDRIELANQLDEIDEDASIFSDFDVSVPGVLPHDWHRDEPWEQNDAWMDQRVAGTAPSPNSKLLVPPSPLSYLQKGHKRPALQGHCNDGDSCLLDAPRGGDLDRFMERSHDSRNALRHLCRTTPRANEAVPVSRRPSRDQWNASHTSQALLSFVSSSSMTRSVSLSSSNQSSSISSQLEERYRAWQRSVRRSRSTRRRTAALLPTKRNDPPKYVSTIQSPTPSWVLKGRVAAKAALKAAKAAQVAARNPQYPEPKSMDEARSTMMALERRMMLLKQSEQHHDSWLGNNGGHGSQNGVDTNDS